MSDEIKWRVSSYGRSFPQGWLTEVFTDAGEAERSYDARIKELSYPGDRVVLYRIKKQIWQFGSDNPFTQTYTDAYKTDVLGRDGKLIHVRNKAPKDIETAERYRLHQQETSHLAYEKRKAIDRRLGA